MVCTKLARRWWVVDWEVFPPQYVVVIDVSRDYRKRPPAGGLNHIDKSYPTTHGGRGLNRTLQYAEQRS